MARDGALAAPALGALVALAALPAGSDRPVLWLLVAAASLVALGGLMLVRARALAERGAAVGLGLGGGLWRVPAVGLVFCLGLAAQMVPWRGGAGSAVPEASALGLMRVLGHVSLFVLTAALARGGCARRRLAWTLLAAIALHAGWGLLALRAFGDVSPWGIKSAYRGMATGGFVNRSAFAAHLGMGLVLAVSLTLAPCAPRSGGAGVRAAAALSLGLVCLAGVVATGSRAGTVAALFGAGVAASACLLAARRAGRLRARPAPAACAGTAVAALAAGFLALAAAGGPLGGRFATLGPDLALRVELWRQTVAMIADRPLAGHGWDGFAPAFERWHRPPLPAAPVWDRPHNGFLTLWAEAGLALGSLPLVAGGLVLLSVARALERAAIAGDGAALPAAALGVLMQAAVHGMVDFSFEVEANMALLIVLAAGGGAVPADRDPNRRERCDGPRRNPDATPA